MYEFNVTIQVPKSDPIDLDSGNSENPNYLSAKDLKTLSFDSS